MVARRARPAGNLSDGALTSADQGPALRGRVTTLFGDGAVIVCERLLPHLGESREGEGTDGHHDVANGNVEVAGQRQIDRDESQPDTCDVGAEPRPGRQYRQTNCELDDSH